MRPPKFAIEAENYITSSIYLRKIGALLHHQYTYATKFAIEAEHSITSSIQATLYATS